MMSGTFWFWKMRQSYRGVELLLDLLVGARQDQTAARTAQGLVGGGGDHVGEGDRVTTPSERQASIWL